MGASLSINVLSSAQTFFPNINRIYITPGYYVIVLKLLILLLKVLILTLLKIGGFIKKKKIGKVRLG